MKFFGRKTALAAGAAPTRPSRARPGGGMILGGILAALAAIFMGMVTALGSAPLTMFVAGALLAVPMLLLISTRMLMPVLFVVVFLIQGTAQFFFNMRAATWGASGLIAMLLARALLELFDTRRHRIALPPGTLLTRTTVTLGCLYLLTYLFSLALGDATTTQRISTLRFSIPIFGVLLALYSYPWEDKRIRSLWTLIICIAFVQLPLATYQHFFMIAAVGWDAVVGSFGRGQSPVLVLFILTAMLYPLARWSRGLMPTWQVSGIAFIGLVIILLGEVKIVFVWLPLGVAFILRRRLLRNVLNLAVFICLSTVFLAGTYTAYKAMYWKSVAKEETMEGKFDSLVGYAVDPHNINYRTGEISRIASLYLWSTDPATGTIERLIGYGPGSTAISTSTGMGKIAARYRGLGVGATALSTLLWDVGLLGTAAYICFLLAGIITGWRYVRRDVDPARSAVVDTSTCMLLLLFSTLIYNRAMVDEPTVQLLCFFCLGCILHYARFDGPKPAAAPAITPAAGWKPANVPATT